MATLAVAMIVKDEIETLPTMLEWLPDLAHEIVIVDTGSTDGTEKLATHRFVWCDDFAAARNYAFQQCESDWIMWLDADDYVTIDTRRDIQHALRNADPCVFFLPYELWQGDQLTMTYPRERIFHRTCEPTWEGRIHETCAYQGERVDVGWPVIHRPRANKPATDRNLRILLDMVINGDSSPRTFFYLANEYRDHGDTRMATLHYETRFYAEGTWVEERYCAGYELGKIQSVNRPHVAIRTYAEAWALQPHRAEPLRQLAHITGDDTFTRLADTLEQPMGLFVEPWAYR